MPRVEEIISGQNWATSKYVVKGVLRNVLDILVTEAWAISPSCTDDVKELKQKILAANPHFSGKESSLAWAVRQLASAGVLRKVKAHGIVWYGSTESIHKIELSGVADQPVVFSDFPTAREFVRELKLSGVAAFRWWASSGDRPSHIPSNPDRTYADNWQGWGDFIQGGHQ